MSEDLHYIYEVQNGDTDSWFPCSIKEVSLEGKIQVSYPDNWLASHWTEAQYVRRRPFEVLAVDEIKPGDLVEVQTNSSENEPFSWWKAVVKKVRGNHAVVRYDAWEEDYDDIFEKSMIRPNNENETLKDHCMNGRCTVSIPDKIQSSVLMNDFAVLNEPTQEAIIFLNDKHSELVLVGSEESLNRAMILAKFILQHLMKFQELYSVMQESVVSLIELVSQPNAQSNPTIRLLQRAISADKPDFEDLSNETEAVAAKQSQSQAAVPAPAPAPVQQEPVLEPEPPVKDVTDEGKVDLDGTLDKLHAAEEKNPQPDPDPNADNKKANASYQYVNDVLLPGEVAVHDEFVIEKRYIGFAIGKGGKNFRHASRIKGIVQTEFSDVTGIIRIMAKNDRALKKAKKLLTRMPPPRKGAGSPTGPQTSTGNTATASPLASDISSNPSTAASTAASTRESSPTGAGPGATPERGSPKPKLIISHPASEPPALPHKRPVEIISSTLVVNEPKPSKRPSIEIPLGVDATTPPRQESDIVPIEQGNKEEGDSTNTKFIARLEPNRDIGLPPRAVSGKSGKGGPTKPPRSGGGTRRSPLPSPVFRKTPRSQASTPTFRRGPLTPSFLNNRGIPHTPSSLPSPLSPSFAYPAFTTDDEKWEFLVYTFKRRYEGKDWADINARDEEREKVQLEKAQAEKARGWNTVGKKR